MQSKKRGLRTETRGPQTSRKSEEKKDTAKFAKDI